MNLFNSLGTLESAGLIQVAKIEPDLEYLFRHSMVQDAAYASLLENDRKQLHLAVGNAIESLYPERRKELAAVLGYHFKEAGQDERALSYFIIAGDEALAAYANQEAESQYRSALGLMCCSGPEIARLYSGLGEALYRQNRFAESTEAFRSGVNLFLSLNDYDGVARLYARMGRVQWYASNRPEGLRICQEGLEVVKHAGDSLGKAALIHETARAYYFNGNSNEALPLCRHALELAERFDDKYLQADTLATLGILGGVDPDESLNALRKATALAEENGYLQVAVRAHINIADMERTWNADNDASLKHLRRAAEIGKLRGVASEQFISLSAYIGCLFAPGKLREIETELPNLETLAKQIPNQAALWCSINFLRGYLVFCRGDWEQAKAIFENCLKTFRDQENHESILNMLDELSWILLEMQRWGEFTDLKEAEMYLMEALEMVDKEISNARIFLYPRITNLKARQGELAEAKQWLEKSMQLVPARRSMMIEQLILESEMELATAGKELDQAIKNIENIVQMEQLTGFRLFYARNLLVWADLLISRNHAGDLENAQTILRKAIDEYTQMGVGRYPELAQDRLKIIQRKLHAQTLDHEKLTRELKKARQVQESLLPENPPKLPGWDLAMLLEPAHETSGDFYDYLVLPDGNLGLVIADVTDKGTSAALFMALSRSLWRTFAANHPSEPEQTIADTNQRILADTHGGLFITVLYAILNPENGEFTYCNAGHLPALILRAQDGSLEELPLTGMPLGVFEEAKWDKASVKIEPGDALLLYTDGVTEAQNKEEEFFGAERLRQVLSEQRGKNAEEILASIREKLSTWVGEADQFDDITMIVVVRD
jgi:serine phosphatase RsbU (regulator of sigma subunit)